MKRTLSYRRRRGGQYFLLSHICFYMMPVGFFVYDTKKNIHLFKRQVFRLGEEAH